jgi:hypothetical protein
MPARQRKAMLFRRCELSMGKADFRESADRKPLVRLLPKFEQITTALTSCYKPTFITIAPRSSSAQHGEVAVFFSSQFLSFTSCHDPSPERAGRFSMFIPQIHVVCDTGVPSSMKKFFHEGISFRPTFQRAFCMQIKTVE